MKVYYIVYKCYTSLGEKIARWYGRFPAPNDEGAKAHCRAIWTEHQGEGLRKEIVLMDSEKDVMFEHRTCKKWEFPLM